MADAEHGLDFLECGVRMFFDLRLEFLGIELGTVEKVLRATVSPDEGFAPPPGWQGQPIPDDLQL